MQVVVERILKEYFSSRPNIDVLQKHVNGEMAAYEEKEAEVKRQNLKRSKTPDEDGFMLVVNQQPAPAKSNKGANKKEEEQFDLLKDFYKFQTRQHSVNQLADLRKKFQEDQVRIAQLRKNKLFDKV
jgi:ribosomal RNA-processing protein 7